MEEEEKNKKQLIEEIKLLQKRITELEKSESERKQAEKRIRESGKKYRDLVEITTDWVWEVDREGVYTYVSPKVKDILGYEVDEVIGKTPFDLMPEDEAKKISKFFGERVIKKEPFFGLENINRHKEGHLVVLETNGTPILDEKGDLVGYRGIDRDITERKRAEEDLRKAKEFLDNTINAFEDPVFVKDEHQCFVMLNDAACKVVGSSREELLGKTVYDCFPKEQADVFREKDELVFKSGETNINEEKITSHGKLYTILTKKSLFTDSLTGKKFLVGTARDITERKEIEEKIRIYAHAIEGAYDAFVITDREWKIIFANHSVLDMYGYRRDKLIGKHVSIFPSESSLKKQKEAIREAETRGSWSGELINKRKNGEEFPIILSLSLIRNEKNEVVGALSIFRDIAETKKLINNLEKTKAELTAKIEDLERFERVTTDRELRMIELKKEINTLLEKLGQPKKYRAPEEIKKESKEGGK